jgi:hypothetical protein
MPVTGSRMLTAAVASLAIAVSISGCAPAFNDARLVPPGQVEITPSVSGAGATADGRSEYLVNTFSVQGQVGVHERVNLGGAYARFQPREGVGGINTIAIGARIGLVKDRVAVSLPVGFAVRDDIAVSDTLSMYPAVLFTAPVSRHIDLNPSVRFFIPLCRECDMEDTLVGFNMGVGLHAAPRLIIRPEVGFLFHPGDSGAVWTFGVGTSVAIGKGAGLGGSR